MQTIRNTARYQAFIGALLLSVTSVCWSAPQVRLDAGNEPQRVIAEGVTSGGTAVFFSVSYERPRWVTRIIERHTIEADDNNDGVIEVALDDTIWLHSVWFVHYFEH